MAPLDDVSARFNFNFDVDDDDVLVGELSELTGDFVDSKSRFKLSINVCLLKKPGSNRDDVDVADSGLDCPDVEDDVSPPVDVNFVAAVVVGFFPLNRLFASSSCDVPVSRHTDLRF